MANYQRYQTLTSAEQYLYSPSCPVWVSRYQISWDTQTTARLLQCRMVNVSEKSISAVYLRVLCRDAQGQDITTLHLVPITGLYVAPGCLFGDDKILALWPNKTAFAEIYAERVCFSDGTAWNEQEPTDYFAIPAPAPVQVQDLTYPKLALAAEEGGVRNDFYFRQLKNVWLCTCGVPNSNQMLHCRHCGADRAWLEQHMDPESLVAPPVKTQEPEPEPEPEPAPTVAAPLEKFDLATYLTTEPMQPPVTEEEFPEIRTYPSRDEMDDEFEDEEEKPKSHAGRIVAIVLAVLLFLGVGGFLAYRQFLGPYAQYQKAVETENLATDEVRLAGEFAAQGGNGVIEAKTHYEAAIEGYKNAIELYGLVPDYEDSTERIRLCGAQIGLTYMRMGEYTLAYDILKEDPDYTVYAADCLYSLGVVAYNENDYATAWEYVGRLEQEFPEYENLQQLHDCCCYEFGKEALSQAEAAFEISDRRSAYEEAKSRFIDAGSYSNSPEMVNLCDYYLADLVKQEADEEGDISMYLQAIDLFGALGDYSDSAQRRKDCMYGYCASISDLGDPTCYNYLTELVSSDYPGAAVLMETLSRLDVEVDIYYDEGGGRIQLPREIALHNAQHIQIRYTVSGFGSATVEILLVYTLPGLQNGQLLINDDGSREGTISLYQLIGEEAEEAGEAKLQLFNSETGEELLSVTFELIE